MTNGYLQSITPDSFSGAIFASEGIRDAVTLVNGPTGCKYYHSAIAGDQMLRRTDFDPLDYSEQWFFGQPRVPCTYLDTRDYVYGSKDKLSEALSFLEREYEFEVLVVVNSPGASLIGDDIKTIAGQCAGGKRIVTIESPGYSKNVWEGYDEACRALITAFEKDILERGVGRRGSDASGRARVNLLGMSIFQKYHEGDLDEFRRTLDLCGIDVNCALCCDCTAAEIADLGHAELNVVVDAPYGLGVAELLKGRFGMPYVASEGMPVGYTGMEGLIGRVCEVLQMDSSAYQVDDERARARTFIFLSRLNSLSGLPKGVPFAVQGDVSQCLGYCRFLIGYLALTADSVVVLGDDKTDSQYQQLVELLEAHGMADALDRDIMETRAQLVFADANIIAGLKLVGHDFSGIEIALPTMGYIDIIPRTHLGTRGGMMLVEQVINGLMF